MEVRDISQSKKVFNPIILTVKIETEEELLILWHRLNISLVELKQVADNISGVRFPDSGGITSSLFNACDKYIRFEKLKTREWSNS